MMETRVSLLVFFFISFCCIIPLSSLLFICEILVISQILYLFLNHDNSFNFISVTQVCVYVLFRLLFQTIVVSQIRGRNTSTALCHPAVPCTAQTGLC